MCKRELTITQANIFTCTARQKRQIGRSASSLTPCIHLPFLPLGPTYTIHLHTSPEIVLTQTDSSDTFLFLLFCPLVRCKSFCDELETVKGHFLFSKLKEKKEKKNLPLRIIAKSFPHQIIKQTLQVYSSFRTLPHVVEEKKLRGKTSHFHCSLC